MKLKKHTCFAYDHQWHFVFPIHEDSSQANHDRSQNNFCAVSSFSLFNLNPYTVQSSHITLITFTEYRLVIFLNPPQKLPLLEKVQVSVFPDAG